MAANPTSFLTPEQYLELDRSSERRSEYHNGEMYPVETSGINHGRIQINLTVALERRLHDSPCQLVGPTVRVRIPGTKRYTYPDLIVACGDLQLEDSENDTLLNPRILFEVLSPSTRNLDQSVKFRLYRTIPSLQEYVMVWQDRMTIERYRRQDHPQWLFDEVSGAGSILTLDSAGCSFPLSEIYSRVELTPQD